MLTTNTLAPGREVHVGASRTYLLLVDDTDCLSLWQLNEVQHSRPAQSESETHCPSTFALTVGTHSSSNPLQSWQRMQHWAGTTAVFHPMYDEVLAVVEPDGNLLVVVSGVEYKTGITAKVRVHSTITHGSTCFAWF